MRPILKIAAAVAVLALAASAQESPQEKKAAAKAQADIDQMLRGAKIIGVEAGIMGPAVKGAPYTADEIHETNQVLADGTKIHNETKTTVSRDSQGRVRRESPGQIIIWDSAAGTTYMLNQSNQTGQKMQMNYIFRKGGPGVPDGPPEPGSFRTFRFDGGGAGGGLITSQEMVILRGADSKAIAEGKSEFRVLPDKDTKKEVLANQIMEGVTCEGVRLTNTIEAGAIGNDRPIQSIEERWYSPDLQVNLLVRKTDPRTGEATIRLTNVRRLEPDPSLFTVPPGYQIK